MSAALDGLTRRGAALGTRGVRAVVARVAEAWRAARPDADIAIGGDRVTVRGHRLVDRWIKDAELRRGRVGGGVEL